MFYSVSVGCFYIDVRGADNSDPEYGVFYYNGETKEDILAEFRKTQLEDRRFIEVLNDVNRPRLLNIDNIVAISIE